MLKALEITNILLSDTPAVASPESDPAAGFLAAEQVSW